MNQSFGGIQHSVFWVLESPCLIL